MNNPAQTTRIQFLDGFRGISIFMLMLGHAFLFNHKDFALLHPFFDGELAVRIFFVTSGFIISHVLNLEFSKNNRIHLTHFFLKRVSKLVPTLYLYTLFIFLLSFTKPLQCSASAFLASLSFTTGVFLNSCWSLGHTWSLSTEELFYLSWAPAYAFLGRWRNTFCWVMVLLISPSVRVLNHMAGLEKYHAILSWYQPIPVLLQLDCILWGSLFALYAHYHREPFTAFVNRFPFLAPIALVLFYLAALPVQKLGVLSVLSYFYLPWGVSIQSLSLAYLVASLFVGSSAMGLKLLFGNPVLSYVGKMSYSLYLWQQICFFPSPTLDPTPLIPGLLKLVLALVIGSLSYHFFEEPVRKWLRKRWALD